MSECVRVWTVRLVGASVGMQRRSEAMVSPNDVPMMQVWNDGPRVIAINAGSNSSHCWVGYE